MPFAGGDGSQSNPYQIETWEHLDSVRNNLSSYFVLNNDLDSNTSDYTGIGDDFEPIGFILGSSFTSEFNGNFDGQGYAIKDLIINYDDTEGDIGLFASTDTNAVIKNIIAEGSITVTNSSGGGLSTHPTGGIVGVNQGGNIDNCLSNITVDVDRGIRIGGFVGSNNAGAINNCYSLNDVNGEDDVGGFVGGNYTNIEDSYSTGLVTAENFAGGFSGNADTEIDCYWDTQSSGQSTSAGAATGLTTSEMQGQEAETNMSGFDFTNNWDSISSEYKYASADGYPILISLDEQNQLEAQGIYTVPQGLFVWTGSTWKKVAGV